MTIDDANAFVNSLWDWGFLNECFGNSGIRVGDMDGIVERNDWHLAFETKGAGVPVKNGQQRNFASLVRKGFTVLILWGKPNQTEQMQIWYPHRNAPEAIQRASNEDVIDIVRRWYNWADANGDVEAAE